MMRLDPWGDTFRDAVAVLGINEDAPVSEPVQYIPPPAFSVEARVAAATQLVFQGAADSRRQFPLAHF